MVKLKYAEGVVPLRNEHCGCTFQSSRIGQTAMSGQKNDRARQSRQMSKQANLMLAVTNWRNISLASKSAWNLFAATYPQSCKNPDSGFLTGYQLFIKRQQYLFINEGIQSEFMEAPFSEVLTLDNYTFTIDQTENCLDVTENYIKNFGLIPMPGQFLLIKVLAYSVRSGQFFPIVTQTIEILESYIDGLFVSLHLPVNCQNTVFSVYLSKPVNESVVYSGTKTRYMGCFTTKTFLGLTDTPDSYVGQAGKKVKVKADESGLEFVPDTGGGLTCADLPACPTIISIISRITTLENIVATSAQTAIPSVNFGLLYNGYCVQLTSNFLPANLQLASDTEMYALATFLGGLSVAGGKMKETGTLHWQTPNTGATNSAGFNNRAAGYRVGPDGSFGQFKTFNYMRTSKLSGSTNLIFYNSFNGGALVDSFSYTIKWGASVIVRKSSTSLSEGMKGTVTDNAGRIYPTIVVNGLEFVAMPWADTKLRDGSTIPLVTNNAAWAALTTPAYCYPNGDINNV